MKHTAIKDKFIGGCVCGQVRYRLTENPMFTHCCHCTQCQQLTGSAFAVNSVIEASNIEVLSGSVEAFVARVEGGRPHDIYRCKDCMSPLWSAFGGRPVRSLRVGSLNDSSLLTPDAHIFVRSKLEWIVIPEDALRFDVFYEFEAVWPPKMLARLNAALSNS